jgi:hypothetical protein
MQCDPPVVARTQEEAMPRKVPADPFVQQVKRQLLALRDAEHGYTVLRVHVAGAAGPWEFDAEDEFDFHEETGVLVVRDGPTGENGHDNAEVPEYVFRLDAVVATQLA